MATVRESVTYFDPLKLTEAALREQGSVLVPLATRYWHSGMTTLLPGIQPGYSYEGPDGSALHYLEGATIGHRNIVPALRMLARQVLTSQGFEPHDFREHDPQQGANPNASMELYTTSKGRDALRGLPEDEMAGTLIEVSLNAAKWRPFPRGFGAEGSRLWTRDEIIVGQRYEVSGGYLASLAIDGITDQAGFSPVILNRLPASPPST